MVIVSDDLSIPSAHYRASRTGRYGTGQSRSQSATKETRRLLLFAGGLAAVLASLIAASAISGRHSNEIPVIAADTRPIREKPLDPGGMKIDGAENDVFSGGSDTRNAKLAPPAEAPDVKLQHQPAPPLTNLQTAQEAAPLPAPPRSQRAEATASAQPPPPHVATPAAPVSKPLVVTNAPPSGKPTPVKLAELKPATPNVPAAAQGAVSAAVSTPAAGPFASAAGAVAGTSPQAASFVARPLADAHPAQSGHQPMVQLAALPSEDAAHNEWQKLVRHMPDLLTSRQPSFQHIERNGHDFWRVRTAGFADLSQARSFCDHVRAKGGGCSVADF